MSPVRRPPAAVPTPRLGILVVTAAEMREIDRRTIEQHGVAGDVLMERAGQGAAAAVRSRFSSHLRRGVVFVVGKGNNGGDALVMARHLRRRRVRCEVFLSTGTEALAGDAGRNLRRWRKAGGKVRELGKTGLPALAAALDGAGLVVDGLFGTGLGGPLRDDAAGIVETINMAPCPIVALDLPSGLDADRGVALGTAVQATLTATFAFPKVGLLVHPGAELAGEVVVVDIGVAPEAVAAVAPRQSLVGVDMLAATVPPRAADTHKGTWGHVLVLAGAKGKGGAAILAARGALRAGAGLTTLAAPGDALGGVIAAAPELMTEPLEGRGGHWAFSTNDPSTLLRLLDGKSAVVFGPGIGTTSSTRSLTEWLLGACPVPLVVDADGLNCLTGQIGWLAGRREPTILTPHPGEMARLLGVSTAEVQADRVGAARRLATAHGVVVVLKGARTIVAAPDGHVGINATGNPGMGSGGMGDALSGVIGALLAHGVRPEKAAAAGVFWHGEAADRVAARRGEAGLLATDVIEELPPALRDVHREAGLLGEP